MKHLQTISQSTIYRSALIGLVAALLLTGTGVWRTADVSANHPVLVEGERDYDGDGLVGPAEDTDNATDRVFGTITAALAAANGGANQNGRVTIVTSGRFHEQLIITNTTSAGGPGNTTIEAAPGVEANIDAVGTGARATQFPGDNATRQGQPGIIVNTPSNTYVRLGHLVIRNWTDGIQVSGNSRVAIYHCDLEGNVNHGIQVSGSARVSIDSSQVNSTGFRVGMTGTFPSPANQPNPGIGIAFRDSSSGTVASTGVTGSFASGIANFTGNPVAVGILSVNVFDNNPNFTGIKPPPGSTPSASTSIPPFN